MYHSEFGRRMRSRSIGNGKDEATTVASARHSPSTSNGSGLHRSQSNVSASAIVHSSTPRLSVELPPLSTHVLGEDDAMFSRRDTDILNVARSDVSRNEEHFASRPQTPKRGVEKDRAMRRKMQGDRFIPNRDESDTQSTFQLMSNEPSTPNRHKRKITAADMDAQKEEANETFTTLLSSELFGAESNAFAAAVGGTYKGANGRQSPYSGAGSSESVRGSVGGSTSTAGRQSLHDPLPSTPRKRNIFRYGSKSPSSSISRSRSIGTLTPGLASSGVRSESASPSHRHSVTGLFGGPPATISVPQAISLDSPQHDVYNASPVSLESQRVLLSPRKAYRTLSKVPYKVLDAPDLADDFYLNLVDWSSKNVLGVGLSNCVYLWSAQTSDVTKLCEVDRDRDRVTSVNWSGRGDYLAVGLNSGAVEIWDTERVQRLRTFSGHTARVGSLAWNENVLSTGSRDRSIYHRDVRAPSQSICELKGHTQEICGLKWNTTTNQLASGGNDNKLFVWDGFATVPLYRFGHHRAAVKAIAWSPHQNGLLVSGGGTADMHIRFFNTITGTLLSEVDTGSQVCNLAWSRINNEIVSTHGFSGGKISNQVQVWRYPDMSQVATLMGHTMRVLYLAMSPDGDSMVSGAGDETLRFWDLNTPGKGILSSSSSSRGFGIHGGSGSLNPFGKLR